MYRRVNSGRFIGLTTLLIVIVMAVFTWVMYGMAQQVFTMTDIMEDLNESIKTMVGTQVSMADDMHSMSTSMSTMNQNITVMNESIGSMTGTMKTMSGAMNNMATNMNRMTYDIGNATYAMSNPMSYMWGNAFPF
jgi:methyl-accepting chemotaxis protein